MDKVDPLDIFPNLCCAKNCFTVKVEIKDAAINFDCIIWGCILVLHLGSPDSRWKFNYKYGYEGFYCQIISMAMDEFM